ncbi:hypothetical protein PF008_g18448 [Phytophthora fragariae]|uniref:Uncharacterized protein n=1 Tax=Phytophthora fragariae TaxID=53985 RepID=A0A6G0R5G2_9STRA|nr:hypothetical protein PF008_g18448 [Phytophthora fragariae]
MARLVLQAERITEYRSLYMYLVPRTCCLNNAVKSRESSLDSHLDPNTRWRCCVSLRAAKHYDTAAAIAANGFAARDDWRRRKSTRRREVGAFQAAAAGVVHARLRYLRGPPMPQCQRAGSPSTLHLQSTRSPQIRSSPTPVIMATETTPLRGEQYASDAQKRKRIVGITCAVVVLTAIIVVLWLTLSGHSSKSTEVTVQTTPEPTPALRTEPPVVITEAPTEPPTEAPAQPATEAPAEPATEAPAEPATEAPADAPAEQPAAAPADQLPAAEPAAEAQPVPAAEPVPVAEPAPEQPAQPAQPAEAAPQEQSAQPADAAPQDQPVQPVDQPAQ